MNRRITTLATAGIVGVAGVTGGFLAGAAILPAGAAQTQTEDGAPADTGDRSFLAERVDRIRDALAGLVRDETITQEQADAVAEELADAAPFGPHHDRGHHHGGLLPGGAGLGAALVAGLDAAAETLDMSQAELREALRDGRTLAEIAEEQGVPTSELVNALVGVARDRLDAAVEDGRVSTERAEEIAAQMEERIAELVEEGVPMGRGWR